MGRAFSRVLAVVAARRDERLSTAKPAGRNRFYKLRLDPAVSLRK